MTLYQAIFLLVPLVALNAAAYWTRANTEPNESITTLALCTLFLDAVIVLAVWLVWAANIGSAA